MPERSNLSIHRLSVTTTERTLIASARLRLPAGEVLALTGPSGVGKSTLLRSINRLQELRPGLRVEADIRLGDLSVYDPRTDPDELRRRIGFLFQRPVVFPGSLRSNLTLALRPARVPRRQWNERIELGLRRAALFDEVADRLDESACHLSLGQQQRLCLARALVLEPEVLLLDEPTSALDQAATERLESGLAELAGAVSVLLVTHDQGQATRLAQRTLSLQPGPDGATLDDPTMSSPPAVRPAAALYTDRPMETTR